MNPTNTATAKKKSFWHEKKLTEDYIERLNYRVKDLEKKIEGNVRFNGLPRWQRILDGVVMWLLAFAAWIVIVNVLFYFFPFLKL